MFAEVLKFDPAQPRDAKGREYGTILKFDPNQPRDAKGRWAKQGIPATMEAFKAKHSEVAKNYPRSSHTEMGSIEAHTKDVGREWQKQLTPEQLRDISDRFGSDVGDVMTAAISLHDIGKAEAIESGHGKESQHEFTVPILQDVMRKEGFSDKDIALATELTNHDLIGPLFRGYEGFTSNQDKVVQALKDKAQKVGMSVSDFVTLQLAFYQADASAYPYVTQFMKQEPSGKWTFKGNKKIAKIEALLQSIAKFDPNQPRGPKGSPEGGRWVKGSEGVSHWEGPGTPEEPVVGRKFTSDEGYDFHEKGPVLEWAKQVPYNDQRAISNYAGFGYKSVNNHLRGKLEPRLEPETIRPATPEEVAKAKEFSMTDEYFKQFGMTADEYLKKFGYTTIMSSKPGPPDDPYHRLPLGPNGEYMGHVVHTPYTSTDDPANYTIQRLAPNMKPLQDAQAEADTINALIRERGYELPEAIQVERGAYIPGLTMEALKEMEGDVWQEDGFTSTSVGSAGGRQDFYPVGAKDESLYDRFGNKMNDHQNEVGAAIRFHIQLPKGTKIVSVEALRRMRYEFPQKPIDRPKPEDINEEYWVENDYSKTPTPKTTDLEDKDRRSESELLLGSGARFRVVEVRRGKPYHRRGMSDTDIIDVYLEYIGGGSSEGVRH